MTVTALRPREKGALAVTRPIRNDNEYNEIVSELDDLSDSDPAEGSPAHDRMELLGILISAYEDEHITPLTPGTPQELVRFMAEQNGLGSSELAEILGGRSRLSEFLNENRELSKSQILRIREALGIPADLLLGA